MKKRISEKGLSQRFCRMAAHAVHVVCAVGVVAVWMLLPSAALAQTNREVSPEIRSVFGKASGVNQEKTANGQPWYKVYDAQQHLLGYVSYSKPASDGITGFAGETPLMVAFDTKRKIKAVVLLENEETPRFVERVSAGGLFSAWNGLTIKQALKKQPDVVSGATYTSKSVIASLHALLSRLDVVEQTHSQWMWGAGGGCLGLLLIVTIRKRRKVRAVA